MAKIVNNFIKGRMNKDLDDRLIPNGEYRNAVNTQVSKSEGNNVGALENSIGNTLVADFSNILGVDLVSIGVYSDEINNRVFLFLTNNYDTAYDPSKTNAIVCYNAGSGATDILVKEKVGQAFLNFYVGNPITGVNLLENLLFFTDNRNQPRVINVDTALSDPTYYDSEDLISVAKYYPFENINLYRQAANITPSGPNQDFETTMFDVTSLAYPDGGSGVVLGSFPGPTANIDLDKTTIQGTVKAGMNIAYLDVDNNLVDTGFTVNSVNYDDTLTTCEVVASGVISGIGTDDTTFIFQFNPYFEGQYNGDKDFLLKKFVRFAYRFRYTDGEYSIFSPFTQECFIPQQDGYFMYDVENVDGSETGPGTPIPINLTSEEDTYRTTTVEFMQNKVDKIVLQIPLPVDAINLVKNFNISEIDILFKESDGLAVYIIDTISVDKIVEQAGVEGEVDPGSAVPVNSYQLINLTGIPRVGSTVTDNLGQITNFPVVADIDSSGVVTLSSPQTLAAGTILTFGNKRIFEYEYQAKKPYKVLPESDLLRTYDKIPVRALSQEIISNRVVYGNYQDKHTPPANLNYNLGVSAKEEFSVGSGTVESIAGLGVPPPVVVLDFVPGSEQGYVNDGAIITGPGIPPGTTIRTYDPLGTIELSQATTGIITASTIYNIQAPSGVANTTSIVEYPNHNLKQNRNYQVGVVLSDKFGRSSTVILSQEDSAANFGGKTYRGSTLFHPYIDEEVDTMSWPGDSLKILFNETISPSAPDNTTLWPGIYNGDASSPDYNPLGWYSYKIVVKQQQQEYYNVYLPGVLAGYPDLELTDVSAAPSVGASIEFAPQEIGKTSHAVLINDNINKVPRDLTEVGPEQRQFRSSVILNGRVENQNSVNPANNNAQFYPGNFPSIVSTIATDTDLFDGNNNPFFEPSAEFYQIDSNPLIARISTPSVAFGVPVTQLAARTPSNPPSPAPIFNAGGQSTLVIQTNTINLISIEGSGVFPQPCSSAPQNCLKRGQRVEGPGIAPDTFVVNLTPDVGTYKAELSKDITSPIAEGEVIQFSPIQNNPTNPPVLPGGIYYYSFPQLAVMETDPVESNLEIFWETSTSGLISDLNTAIINSTNSSVDFSSFNTSAFIESLAPGNNILAASFTLIDELGNPITYAPTVPPQLELIAVRDLNNNTVNIGPGAVFELVRIGSNYNIQFNGTNMPSANPPDSFYFRYDRDAVTFNFEFLATINGVSTTIVKNAILQNEVPSLTATRPCDATFTWNCGDVTYPLYKRTAVNGSAGVATGQAFLDFSSSFTVTASDGTDYTTSFTTAESNFNGELVVDFGFNGSATVPDGDYTVEITFTDAGPAEVTCTTILTVNNVCCRRYSGIIPSSWTGGTIGYTTCEGELASTYYGPEAAGATATFCSRTIPTPSPAFTLLDVGACE